MARPFCSKSGGKEWSCFWYILTLCVMYILYYYECADLMLLSYCIFQACMWGEFVNSINLIPRLWPRASAVAERLWSAASVTDVHLAAQRLQEHECRMLQRGYRVEPSNGPGFCQIDWATKIFRN